MATKATLAKTEDRIQVKPAQREGVMSYDVDNLYLQRVEEIVNNSGTAKACIRLLARFIKGEGLADPDFYKYKVNLNGLTVDGLNRHIAGELATFSAFAFHVNYNQSFQSCEINIVNVKDLRIPLLPGTKLPDFTKAALYDNWDGRKGQFKKNDIDILDRFNDDPNIVSEQIEEADGFDNYKGQIYWWTPKGDCYTLVEYDSVLEDMQTEGELKTFRFRSVRTNFLASHVVITGESETEEEREKFKQSFENLQGGNNTAKIVIVEKESDADIFDIQKMELQNYDDLYQNTKTDVKDNITENFLIPKPLLLRGTASIGSSKEIADSKIFYNEITADYRILLEETYARVFGGNWFEVACPSGNYSIVPVHVTQPIERAYLNVATKNEIRESIGLPPLEEKEANTQKPIEILGVGGVQALTAIISDPILTDNQKKAQIQIIFGFTEQEALLMMDLKPENNDIVN